MSLLELILYIFNVLTFPSLGIYMMYVSLKRFLQIKKNNQSNFNVLKKWMSLNEIGGFLGYVGLLVLALGYFNNTKCGLDFELRDDGYYLVLNESEINTHTGTSYEYPKYLDGPFSELEMTKMLDECNTPLQELKRKINVYIKR